VRIAPNTVLVSDPHTIRKVLAVNSSYIRGPWYDSLRSDPHEHNVMSERDPKQHSHRRQLLAAGLSGKDIPGAESIIDSHVQSWMQTLDQKLLPSEEGELRVNISRALPYLIMDIITHLCLDEPFGNIESDTDRYDLLGTLESSMLIQQYRTFLPELNAFIFWLGSWSFLQDIVFPSANTPGGIGQLMQVYIMLPCMRKLDFNITLAHRQKIKREDDRHMRPNPYSRHDRFIPTQRP